MSPCLQTSLGSSRWHRTPPDVSMSPDDSGRLQTTSDDSRRLDGTEHLQTSSCLQTALGSSKWHRTPPDVSMSSDVSRRLRTFIIRATCICISQNICDF
ncbi:hypothetical protein ElyMa_006878800 [Elysia marginata]|uniref:Uncharacterized protein n=1 Tax=Elysia marginata TaxID=1093978 RepID=A0AAV4JDZ6_9GAST|nr:hypothetical protein ElyMa_006878800 [Elysia marginata]